MSSPSPSSAFPPPAYAALPPSAAPPTGSSVGCPPPPPAQRPKISSNYHESRHWSRECPAAGRASMGGQPHHNVTNPLPDPCWACPGEYHWVHQREKSNSRCAAGLCVLCGSAHHWFKKCPLYIPAIHTTKLRNNCLAGTGPPRPNYRQGITWCLRHGNVITQPLLVTVRVLQFCFQQRMCENSMLAAVCGAECLAMMPLRVCDELLCWHPKKRPRFNA